MAISKLKLDSLDKLFSEYIRKRALQRVSGCERCLRPKLAYQQLQCSHFHGRSKQSTRWDEDNAVGLCAGCHMHLTSHPQEHLEWFMNYLGEEKFNMLNGRMRITYPKTDKNLLELYFKEKLKQVELHGKGGERC